MEGEVLSESPENSASANTCKPFMPPLVHVMHALLHAMGWLARKSMDSIAWAGNGAQAMRHLRQRFGWACIEIEHIHVIDRDGFPTQPGRDRFTEEGREARSGEGANKAPHLNTPIPAVLQLRRCARKAQPGLASR